MREFVLFITEMLLITAIILSFGLLISEQVLINLSINAVHALENVDEPQIILSSRFNKNDRVIIEIADNGHGIKAELMDKIFMPFFTSKKEGSGVGLSLSRQIMHLHKGNIFVKSVEGKGSVFTLVF